MKSKIALAILSLALIFGSWPAKAQLSGVTLYYVATAVDSSGAESVYSNQTSCTFTAAKFHCVLTWTASTSTVSGYNVYRGTATGGPYAKINPSLVTTLTYTDVYAFPNPPTGLAAVNN